MPMSWKRRTVLGVVAAVALSGCSRRSRVDALPPPVMRVEQSTAVATAGQSAPDPALTPDVPFSSAGVSAALPMATPTVIPMATATAVPLDPVWEELEATLAELDAALAGIEIWEVAVP